MLYGYRGSTALKNKDEYDVVSDAMRRINRLINTIQDSVDAGAINMVSEVNQVGSGQLPTKTITFVIIEPLLDRWKEEQAKKSIEELK